MPTHLRDTARLLLENSLRVAGPALLPAAARRRRHGSAPGVGQVLRGEIVPASPAPPHPLLPAAVRVERSRRRGGATSADQVAVTLWFREGPALPGPGAGEGGELTRMAVRLGIGLVRAGAGLAGAAAIGAATVAASRLEAARQPRRIGDQPGTMVLPASPTGRSARGR